MRLSFRILVLTLVLLALPFVTLPARADHDHDHGAESLGKVHFPVSCAPEQQATFDRAVALMHSFGYARSEAAFNQVATADPKCAMAQWGIAMANYHMIWGPSTEEEVARGRAAAEKAAAMSSSVAKEADWIRAIGAFYIEPAPRPHPERVAAFETAMAGLAARYPDDHEVAIFRALALLGVAYNSPPDKTYAKQKQAAEMLNRILPLEPEHPGVAHYMIHSFDYPELASLALEAARAYAKIAPAAPHALHMPSHIFTRLGLWSESIDSNLASAKSAQQLLSSTKPGATAFDALHAMDYLAYAYLQTARDGDAKQIVDGVAQVSAVDSPIFSAGFALSAVPARWALERRDWKSAAALVPHPVFPWEKFPYAESNIHFARGVGAARAGDLETARAAVAKLTAIQISLQSQKGFDWATQVEIQRLAAAGWLAQAEKKDDEALALLRKAADLEDSTDKHPVTPGSILPAREQLADLYAELGRPKEALAEYTRSLATAPARYVTLLGAAKAAEAAADAAAAKSYYGKLAELTAGSSSERARAAQSGAKVAAH